MCSEPCMHPAMPLSDFPTVVNAIEGLALPERSLHLAMGVFDGLHLGHQAVIEAALHSARRTGGLAAVLTFDPHPSRLFRPEAPTRLIMPREIKARSLAEMGVDLIIFQPFTHEFATLEAEAFPQFLKTHLPTLAALYIGENFRYGKKRRGDVRMLINSARALEVSVFSIERIRENGEPISSTRIRAALEAGELAAANALLGYAYRSRARITPGRQLGRTIGFPTLNLPWEPELLPRFGVYCVRARNVTLGMETAFPGVANYGLRPTVEVTGAARPQLEVHLLEPVSWEPGQVVEAAWEHFLRPEKKFSDLQTLQVQIARDKLAATRFF